MQGLAYAYKDVGCLHYYIIILLLLYIIILLYYIIILATFRSEYEYEYDYEFSVLSMRTLTNVDLEI